MQKTVALHTLGCKLNFSETTAMGRMMEQAGFAQKSFDDIADIYVINTCSVTDNADKECRQLVRRIQRKAPEAMVVVTGCYAQLKPAEIAAIPGVNLVLGAKEKFNIASHIQELKKNESGKICSCDIEDVNIFTASHSVNERTRVFLKVQDGCDYNCSFCTIPLARGRSRSDTVSSVLTEIEKIASAGAKEIVLTGINLGDFGKGFSPGKKHEETFFDLMQAIEKQAAVPRYRISSIEPNLLSHDMIDFVKDSKVFMPHFHIPLQSGSNEILGQMRRRYKRELYAEKVAHIKEVMPHACIGVDVIVGFPGETQEHFMETYDFLKDINVNYLHVFTYSERENTLAATMPGKIQVGERNIRNKKLRELSYHKMMEFTQAHIGTNRSVLFESANKNGMMEGYSDNYIRVETLFDPSKENQLVNWII